MSRLTPQWKTATTIIFEYIFSVNSQRQAARGRCDFGAWDSKAAQPTNCQVDRHHLEFYCIAPSSSLVFSYCARKILLELFQVFHFSCST
jgi:hypothetical protein